MSNLDLAERLDVISHLASAWLGKGMLAAVDWRDGLIEVGSKLDELINELLEES